MNKKVEEQLLKWWLGELSKLTEKVIKAEDKRKERIRKKNQQLFGDACIERREDIDDLYGYGAITAKKRDKLIRILEEANENDGELYQEQIKLISDLYQESKQALADLKKEMNE